MAVNGKGQKRSRKFYFTIGAGISAALFFLTLMVLILLNNYSNSKPISNVEVPITENPDLPTSVSGRYLFNGTIFWGRAIQKWSKLPDGSYDYDQPFSGLDTFERDKYDAWVADHECPVLDIVIPFETQVNNLVFNCPPEYLPSAKKFFNIVDLANNHTGDQGLDGFETTRDNFIKAGFQVYGNFDPSVKEDICEVVALPINILKKDGTSDKQDLPVAFCAWHYFGRTPLYGEIEHMKQYAQIMPVFAFVHMGAEYQTEAQPIQREIAHRVAEQGPEFVIANNPHWVQDSEVFKDTLIVYSTGNFIFDQLDYEGNRSVSIDLSITTDHDDNIAKWIELGQICKASQLHDNCFEMAKTKGLNKVKFKKAFEAVGGDNSDHITKKAGPELQAAIEKRLKWGETIKDLQ